MSQRKRANSFETAGPCDGTLQAHAVALRPEWFHLWNVSPTRPPQPHWQPAGQPRLYGPDYTFLMVLQTSQPGAAPRWTVAGEAGAAVALSAAGRRVTAAWHDTTLTLSGDVALELAAGA